MKAKGTIGKGGESVERERGKGKYAQECHNLLYMLIKKFKDLLGTKLEHT